MTLSNDLQEEKLLIIEHITDLVLIYDYYYTIHLLKMTIFKWEMMQSIFLSKRVEDKAL